MNNTTTQLAYIVGTFAVLFGAAAVVAIPLGRDDEIAVGALALTPIALVGFYVMAQGVIGDRHFGAIMAVIYVFVAAAIFRTRAYEDKSIDLQVAMKLAAFAVISITNIAFFSSALGRIRFPRLFYLWLTFFVALVGCSLYAVNVPFALICSVLFLSGYLYMVYTAVWLSRVTAVQIMMCAALLICIGSIFVFFAMPSVGVMQGWTPEAGLGETGRMKGITGSANGIGLIAGFSLTLAVLYFRSFRLFGKCVALMVIPSSLVCLILSNNRSSMIAVAAAVWFAFVFRRNAGPKIMLTALVGILGAAALTFFSDEIFSALSRSGQVKEITSATGRAEIWSVVLEMIWQRPLYGYGYTSALAILPLDPRLFHAAAHTHNMYLELLFAGGAILLGIFLYAVWQTFRQALRLGAVNEAAVLIFFMLRGLTEATPFSGMVSYASLAFTLALALIIAPLARAQTAPAPMRPTAAPGVAPALRQSRL